MVSPAALAVLLLLILPQQSTPCGTVADCRAQAEAAVAQGDYERFHDLAWRAVQKGKPNDPALMYLLARAMSLSGRPGDAYVMLSRLVDMGVPIDAATNEDFRRVRALRNWPELEAKLTPVPSGTPTAAVGPPATPSPVETRGAATRESPPAAAEASPAAAPKAAVAAPAPLTSATLTFDATPFSPVGLAYDAVSRRFLVGDKKADRLIVIDEPSHHVSNLVGAAAAGFRDDLTAFDIDRRRGDLWVVSASGEGEHAASTLHKLQLISGRTLLDIAADGVGAVRFVGVSVAADGTVWLLDAAGLRLLQVRPGSRALEVVAKLDVPAVSALAVSDNGEAYIAARSGILRVDLTNHAVTAVKSPQPLPPFSELRWFRGTLIAIDEGSSRARLLRLKLDGSGGAIRSIGVLAEDLPKETAGAVAGDTFYYLAGPREIRGIKLK